MNWKRSQISKPMNLSDRGTRYPLSYVRRDQSPLWASGCPTLTTTCFRWILSCRRYYWVGRHCDSFLRQFCILNSSLFWVTRNLSRYISLNFPTRFPFFHYYKESRDFWMLDRTPLFFIFPASFSRSRLSLYIEAIGEHKSHPCNPSHLLHKLLPIPL